MAESHLRTSALAPLGLRAAAGAPDDSAGVGMRERSPRTQFAVRVDARSRAFTRAGAGLVSLPLEPNTSTTEDGITALRLGPDEWLLVGDDRLRERAAALDRALAKVHRAIVDVSDSRGAVGLRGPRAREVLMKGTSLDLHPRRFGPGACAQSALARCHMLLHQIDDTPSYDVYVHRSFMGYAWAWLWDAASEYSVVVDPGEG